MKLMNIINSYIEKVSNREFSFVKPVLEIEIRIAGSFFNLSNVSNIWFLIIDKITDFNSIRNFEIEKLCLNMKNGLLDMNRDINLKLLQFSSSTEDVKEVYLFYFFLICLL
jgi:hypothetical protein